MISVCSFHHDNCQVVKLFKGHDDGVYKAVNFVSGEVVTIKSANKLCLGFDKGKAFLQNTVTGADEWIHWKMVVFKDVHTNELFVETNGQTIGIAEFQDDCKAGIMLFFS